MENGVNGRGAPWPSFTTFPTGTPGDSPPSSPPVLFHLQPPPLSRILLESILGVGLDRHLLGMMQEYGGRCELTDRINYISVFALGRV